MKYGIIAGITDDLQVEAAINLLRQEGVPNVIVNGDLGQKEDEFSTKHHLVKVLTRLGRSGLTTMVIPGGQETVRTYEPVISAITESWPNVFDMRRSLIAGNDDHQLLFLPGTEKPTSKYQYGINFDRTCLCIKERDSLQPIAVDEMIPYKYPDKDFFVYFNLLDLQKVLYSPNKTVLITPQAPRFHHFGAIDARMCGKNLINKYKKISPKKFSEYDCSFENMGSELLKEYMNITGITKSVSSMKTINPQQANNSRGAKLTNTKFRDDIHYNSGRLEDLLVGIIEVQGEWMNFENYNISQELEMVKNTLTVYKG